MTHEISIVIPVGHPHKQIVRDLLKDLSRQPSASKFEIILVADNTFLNETAISDIFPSLHFKFLKISANSAAKARNIGVQQSTSDIIIFADADMRLDSGDLETFIAPIKKGPILCSQPIITQDKIDISSLTIHAMNFYFIDSCFFAIKKTLFNEVGGFDPCFKTMEDADLSIRLFMRGGIFLSDQSLKVTKTDHRSTAGRFLRAINFGRSQRIFLQKYHHPNFNRIKLLKEFFYKSISSLKYDIYSTMTNLISSFTCLILYKDARTKLNEWNTHAVITRDRITLIENRNFVIFTKIFNNKEKIDKIIGMGDELLTTLLNLTPDEYHVENMVAFHERRVRLWDRKENSNWKKN